MATGSSEQERDEQKLRRAGAPARSVRTVGETGGSEHGREFLSLGGHAMRSRVQSPLGAERPDAVDAGHAPPGGVGLVALDVHAELDGLRDERARRRVDDLLDELAEPIEHGARVVRVDGGDAARVAGVPGLEQLERRAVAHLADQDAIRAETASPP